MLDQDQITETGETARDRRNRNWAEILQELRVIQTGSQIITGFLLAAAFQPRFMELQATERWIYLALVTIAITTTILGMTPVMLHRVLFRKGAKESLILLGNRFATATLIGVGITVVGIALLIFDLVWGIVAGVLVAALTAVLIGVLWGVVPAVTRRRHRSED